MTSAVRGIGIVAAVLLSAGALGPMTACGGSAASKPPATASGIGPEDDDATAGLMDHHRHHHHGGVTLFVAMSLDTLGISHEQQAAVEKIRADLYAGMEPARAAEQNLITILTDGVAAGTLDAAKVDTAVQQLTAAAATTVHDASAGALNQLHEVLTPPQRSALVDKVQAHWAVWQKANAEEAAGGRPEGGRLATLATELDLTPDQVAQVRAALADPTKAMPRLDPQEIAAYLTAFGDAFRSDTFDARTLTAADRANAHLVGWGSAHMAHLVEALSPLLTPEQRVELAQHLREHTSHDPSAEANP